MSRVMEAMILEGETEQDVMDSSMDLPEDEVDLSDNENAEEEENEQPEPQEEEHREGEKEVPEIDYDRFLPILDFSKVTDEEICHAACNKLLQDSYFGINGFPVIACFLWAYNKAKDDLPFAKQVCVKSKNFSKAFDYLKKVITLSVEKNILSVKKNSKRGVAQIALTDKSFPDIPALEAVGKDSIPVKEFLRAIKTTSYAMSKNESKILYTGLHMSSDGQSLSLFAIDGFRVSL